MIIKSYLFNNSKEITKYKSVLFYGENTGLINNMKENIKSLNKDVEIFKIFQNDVLENTNNFYKEFLNLDLFEKEKIFFISGCTDKIFDLIENLEENIKDQKIFLFADILDKRSKLRNWYEKSRKYACVACYNDDEISLRKIILQELKEYKELSPQNINLLIDNSNLDRIKLNNELNKIKAFFLNKEINSVKLEELLNLRENNNFNQLNDMAIIGEKNVTNKLLNNSNLEQEKSVFYINIISKRLNKLKECLEHSTQTNLDSIIDNLKPPVFWKDKPILKKQIKKWNTKKINKAIEETYIVELQLKSNASIDKNLLVKNTIIKICNIANSV